MSTYLYLCTQGMYVCLYKVPNKKSISLCIVASVGSRADPIKTRPAVMQTAFGTATHAAVQRQPHARTPPPQITPRTHSRCQRTIEQTACTTCVLGQLPTPSSCGRGVTQPTFKLATTTITLTTTITSTTTYTSTCTYHSTTTLRGPDPSMLFPYGIHLAREFAPSTRLARASNWVHDTPTTAGTAGMPTPVGRRVCAFQKGPPMAIPSRRQDLSLG